MLTLSTSENGATVIASINANFTETQAAPDTTARARFLEDFVGGLITNSAPFNLNASGAGAAIDATVASESSHPGIGRIGTGTTTTGSTVVISKSASLVVLGADAWTIRVIFSIPTLSDGTETYTLRLGFGDSTTGGEPTDGVFLRYTHSVNSGKFEAVTRSNTTETATDTGVTAAAATWYRLDIQVNAAGTSAAFYLKTGTGASTLVATITTNIPITTTRATGVQVGILKSAGTTSRTLDLDLIDAAVTFGTSR